MELQGIITEGGKMQVYNQAALNGFRLNNAGREIILSVKVKRKTRSPKQNGYYWAVVIPLVMEAINKFGNVFSEKETHEFLKAKFNSVELQPVPDNFIEVPQSTSKLDTTGFMNYIEKIQLFASQMLGIYIPLPNEQTTIDYTLNEQP